MSLAEIIERHALALTRGADKADIAAAGFADHQERHASSAGALVEVFELRRRQRHDVAGLVFGVEERSIRQIALVAERDAEV